MVATPMLFSTATMFLRRALQSPQMQGVKCHPSKPGNTRCTAVKPPCSVSRNRSTCRNTRSEQGQHRQHGGRASVRLYSRDDVWGALACQRFVVQKVADAFRPLTAQGRGTQIPMAGPPVKIDPLTVPMEVVPDDFDSTPISQTTATKVRVETSHRPRRSSKLQTLLAHPGDKEEPTASSVTSSEPSLRKKPTLQATNAWKHSICDERPHSSSLCGGVMLQQGQTFRGRWSTTENDFTRPAVATSHCCRHAA